VTPSGWARAGKLADAMLKRFVDSGGRLLETWDSNLLVEPPGDGDRVQPSGGFFRDRSAAGNWRASRARRATPTLRGGALVPLAAQITAAPSEWGGLIAPLSRPQLAAALEQAPVERPVERGSLACRVRPTRSAPALPCYRPRPPPSWWSPSRWPRAFTSMRIRPSQPELIPTELTLSGHPDMKVDYPASRDLQAIVRAAGDCDLRGRIHAARPRLPQASSKLLSPASLRVQACNDKYCLAPATVSVPIDTLRR